MKPASCLRSCGAVLLMLSLRDGLAAQSTIAFDLTLEPAAAAGITRLGLETPVYGRAYVIVSSDSTREPRRQIGVAGSPFWGRDVDALAAGVSVTLSDGDGTFGYPLRRIADLPAGDYYVQAFLNVYTTFHRADGHTVRMHQDAGDGQDPWVSPGNVHSAVRRIHLDPARGGVIRLSLSDVIQPADPVPPDGTLQQGNPPDRDHVRFVKIQSALLSQFWGRDMWIGANVLLPRDYDDSGRTQYPTLYYQGHFPGSGAPFGFGRPSRRSGASDFDAFWLSDDAPSVVVVSIRDANPFYDTSYSVNSANLGPYGDAITRELIPYLEGAFHLIPDRGKRLLAGGSTGGWEALAMQIFDPDTFGGAWGWCPDAVDFHYHQIVNVYEDDNAYVLDRGWLKVERPGMRRPDGNVMYTMRDENYLERAVGTHSRSAGQWAIWEAVYGPVGPGGYPAPIWDPATGQIHEDVAAYWKQHYDLTDYLRRNWNTLGPKLTGRIHVAVGAMDSYYLNDAVHLLQDAMDGFSDPPANATFEYGDRKPHCWIGGSLVSPGADLSTTEFVKEVGRLLSPPR